MVSKDTQIFFFFWPNSKKIFVLKIRLSIRIRNFAALNEPQNKKYFNPIYSVKIMNPRDRKSHTWAPLSFTKAKPTPDLSDLQDHSGICCNPGSGRSSS
jgi:hypothetical protein